MASQKKTKKDVLSFLTYDCAKLYFHRYKEVCKFNFNNPGWGYRTGHFTQVVWEKSVELGIGKQSRDGVPMWLAAISLQETC